MQSHPLQPSAARGCTHAGCRTAARSLLIIARELRPPRAQSYGLTPQTPKPISQQHCECWGATLSLAECGFSPSFLVPEDSLMFKKPPDLH